MGTALEDEVFQGALYLVHSPTLLAFHVAWTVDLNTGPEIYEQTK